VADVLLALISATSLAMVLVCLRHRDGPYTFPFLAGAIYLVFLIPQFVGHRGNTTLPSGALEKALLMALLCLWMCWAGWYAGANRFASAVNDFDQRRLLYGATLLAICGMFFFFSISRIPDDQKVGQWSGLPVAYYFFAKTLPYAFAIAMFCFAKASSRWALAIIVICGIFYADRILIAGRRGIAFECIFIVLMAYWFHRRKTIPRFAMIALAALSPFILFNTGEYRQAVRDGPGTVAKDFDPMDNVANILEEGGEETRNTIIHIAAKDWTRDFDFGIFHWDQLVFNYVPAQIIGIDAKRSLMSDVSNDAYAIYGHQDAVGSTVTGLSDAFASFWYFGCFKFFIISWVLARLYYGAMEGSMAAAIIYALMISNGVHSITHHTSWFVSPWVHLVVFLGPCLWLARLQYRTRSGPVPG